MKEFLYMGGYAFYVWTSYALALLMLGGVVVWSLWQSRRIRVRAIRQARQRRRER